MARTLVLVLLGACNVPLPQHALTVRDPDKLCWPLSFFSACAAPSVAAPGDAGDD